MKEIRNNDIIKRSDNSESRIIEGYAIVFNSRSEDLGGFYETINPNAISQETIDNSDILFLLDHNTQRGVLARSNKGNGSLELKLDEKGLYFRFEAPETSLGEEVLQGIKRGDISKCSFAFTVESDEYTKESDGTILRTINKINRLYDCSVVYHPAYNETSVDTRGLEAFLSHSNEENNADNIINPMTENKRSTEDIMKEIEELKTILQERENEERSEKEKEEEKEEQKEDSADTEKEEKNCDNSETDKEEKSNEEETEEKEEKDNSNEESEKEEERKIEQPNLYNKGKKENRNNNNNIINYNHTSMKKEFNLLRNINNLIQGKELDSVAKELTIEGRNQASKMGISTNAQIVVPFEIENRFEDNPNGIIASTEPSATVSGMGSEVVPTVKTDLLGSIKQKMVLNDLGCRWFNLTSNIEIPYIEEGDKAYWQSEISKAPTSDTKFKIVKLEPKRISVVKYISKQWAMQTSPSANETLMDEITYAIAHKLQETLLGDGAGDDVTPAGIFNGVSADAANVDFESVVSMEELLEARGYSDYKYLASPSAKAVLRTTVKGENANAGFIMQNGEIEGRTVLSSGDVTPKGLICGDFSQMAIASFAGIEFLINPYSYARSNQIEIVATAYFDVATIRENAFVKRILK